MILYTHADCAEHVTPPGHPERVERIKAVWAALDAPEFDGLDRREAPLVDRDELLRVHPEDYVAMIEGAVPDEGWVSIDGDTHMSAGSLRAAQRGAGACVAAVDAVLGGEAKGAFAAVRPPGHHAETATAMGFCFFGNVAIAAKRALDHHGLDRVAIIDFDVHHGNGTQDLVWNEPRCLFASTHQMPLYPGSGHASETGASNNIHNVPLPAGAGGAAFRKAMEGHVLPAVDQFAPQLIIISAGFDAHMADPLANLEFTSQDFAWATEVICDLADTHAEGRVVSSLEGGYDLDGLATSTAAHVKVLMERCP